MGIHSTRVAGYDFRGGSLLEAVVVGRYRFFFHNVHILISYGRGLLREEKRAFIVFIP